MATYLSGLVLGSVPLILSGKIQLIKNLHSLREPSRPSIARCICLEKGTKIPNKILELKQIKDQIVIDKL